MMSAIGFQPNAILYQFLTDEMMTSVMKDIFPVLNESSVTQITKHIIRYSKIIGDYAEVNTLPVMSLKKKIHKSGNPLKVQ